MLADRVKRFFSHARYITLGMMDGSLAALSAVSAAYLAGVSEPSALFRILIGIGIGISASNFSGAYLAEQAEINKERHRIEKAMGLKRGHLKHTLLGYKLRKKVLIRSFTNSGAAFLGILFAALPLLFLPYTAAVTASVLSAMGLLFLLGVYLGHYNRASLLTNGIKVLLISIVVLVLNLLISKV
ncbi:MAG: hypothetical protein V1787_00875 [Candidatus Micrarchaeota archaeon]